MKMSTLLGLCLLTVLSVKAQQFENLDFEMPCSQLKAKECAWFSSWGAKGSSAISKEGTNAFLQLSGDDEGAVCFVEQALNYQTKELMIIELSADVKTENVKGRGAGLNLGIYDAANKLLISKDMGGFYATNWGKGSTDWHRIKIKAILPATTHSIRIGAILYGEGQAALDNFAVEIKTLEGRQANKRAREYIGAALDSIKLHSLYRASLDEQLMREIALKIAGDAQSDADCHLAVEYLLSTLRTYGDNHSFFMAAKDVKHWEEDDSPEEKITFPRVQLIEEVGYVFVPSFHSGNDDLIQLYADSLQRGLEQVFSSELKGWIVDLRENMGGNMAPMIAGLGPLIDEGPMGALVDVNGQKEHWHYENGTYGWEEERDTIVRHPIKINKKLPMAVLFSPKTGSSGEITAISFIGNSRTITMGQPTWGLTTGNGDFELPDGSKIFLASTYMADRNGKVYQAKIDPDIFFKAPEIEEDILLPFAIDWVKRQYRSK